MMGVLMLAGLAVCVVLGMVAFSHLFDGDVDA